MCTVASVGMDRSIITNQSIQRRGQVLRRSAFEVFADNTAVLSSRLSSWLLVATWAHSFDRAGECCERSQDDDITVECAMVPGGIDAT